MEHHDTEELLRSLSSLLYRHLLKIGADREDAKDIVQEAVYKWLLYSDSVQPERVPAWLFRVAVNLYYDLCRKRKRHMVIEWDEALLLEIETPETAVLRQEDRQRIRRALHALPPTQQHLLVLKYEERLSYAQISMLLGVPVSTISTYLHRARAKYKQAYGEDL